MCITDFFKNLFTISPPLPKKPSISPIQFFPRTACFTFTLPLILRALNLLVNALNVRVILQRDVRHYPVQLLVTRRALHAQLDFKYLIKFEAN